MTGTIFAGSTEGKRLAKELETLHASEIWEMPFMAAIPRGIELVCTQTGATEWKFAGTFCGVPVCQASITLAGNAYLFTVKEA